MTKKFFWLLLSLMLVYLQYHLWFGEGSISYVWKLDRAIVKKTDSNQDLKQRNERLEARIIEYRQGKDILEEQARSQLGLIKNNETFIQVLDDKVENNN
jgi:cell division protein FtsB